MTLYKVTANDEYLRFFGVYEGGCIDRGKLAKRCEARTTSKPRKIVNTVLAVDFICPL